MNKFEELVLEMGKNPIYVETQHKYRNNIDLSGYLLRKPKFIKHDKTGTESCSFLLYQLTQTIYGLDIQIFSCITYVRELVEQLKENDKVLFLATVGKLRYSKKVHGLYTQVVEMKTLYELENNLLEPWKEEEK